MNIIIGTANFNQPYGRNQFQADPTEIILKAKQLGINILDASANYGEYEDPTHPPDLYSGFKWIVKISEPEHIEYALEHDVDNVYAIMAHGYQAWQRLGHIMSNTIPTNIKIGASLYDPKELDAPFPSMLQIVEFPINIVDQRWVPYLNTLRMRRVETIARSLFLHGTLWESSWKGYPLAHFSLNMVKANPLIDRIIVGVDNAEQLEQIYQMPELEVNYEHLSSNRSKKWLKPVTKQDFPLFGKENGSRQGVGENDAKSVDQSGGGGNDPRPGGQEDHTDSPAA